MRIDKIKVIIVILILNIVTYANASNIALDIARTNKMEKVITNVKYVANFINLYALQTGKLPDNFTTLQSKYPNISNESYLNNSVFTFTIADNIITVKSILPSDRSDILELAFNNLVKTKLNASVTADNNININLEYKTIKFLSKVNLLNETNNGSIYIQDSKPIDTNTVTIAYGDMWYRPDIDGGFYIYYYTSNDIWQYLSNKLDIYIYRNDFTDLGKIIAPKGTKAYANVSGSTTDVNEYISNGTTWLKATY